MKKSTSTKIQKVYENKLEPVFACNIKTPEKAVNAYSFTAKTRISPKIGIKKPKVLIPVFPGTNCEYDTTRAFINAGADPEVMVIKNLSASDVTESVNVSPKKLKLRR